MEGIGLKNNLENVYGENVVVHDVSKSCPGCLRHLFVDKCPHSPRLSQIYHKVNPHIRTLLCSNRVVGLVPS